MNSEMQVKADQGSLETMAKQQEERALVLRDEVKELVVIDDESFAKVESIETAAKDTAKAREEYMAPFIQDAHSKHKKLTTIRNRMVNPYKELAKECRQKRIAYAEEQKRIAEAERRAAEEAARKAQEEARLAQAEKLEAEGNKEQADKVIDAPAAPAPVVPKRETAEVKGARTTWTAEIEDLGKLFETLSKNPPALNEDQTAKFLTIIKAHDMARAFKTNLSSIMPGLKSVKKIS